MNTYDGPSLARWIDTRPEARRLTDNDRRKLRHWAAGHNPTEPTVDSLLCSIRIHLTEVPTWVVMGWTPEALEGLEIQWAMDGTRYLRRAA